MTNGDRSEEVHGRMRWEEKELRNPAWERREEPWTAWHCLTLWLVAVRAEILGYKSKDAWVPQSSHFAALTPIHTLRHLPPSPTGKDKIQYIYIIFLARAQRQEHTSSPSSSGRLNMHLTSNHCAQKKSMLIGQLGSHAHRHSQGGGAVWLAASAGVCECPWS